MPDYDFSRQLDLHKLNYKLRDPNLPEWEKKKIENAIHAIRDQAKFKSVAKLREKVNSAVRNRDPREIEAIQKEAERIDQNYKY